jgi:hypothetical protein
VVPAARAARATTAGGDSMEKSWKNHRIFQILLRQAMSLAAKSQMIHHNNLVICQRPLAVDQRGMIPYILS